MVCACVTAAQTENGTLTRHGAQCYVYAELIIQSSMWTKRHVKKILRDCKNVIWTQTEDQDKGSRQESRKQYHLFVVSQNTRAFDQSHA